MRFFFFLFFISTHVLAQIDVGLGGMGACDENDLMTFNGITLECATLDINVGSLSTAQLADPTFILRVRVMGAVNITNTVNFEGQNGQTAAAISGGLGGPGAGVGGDNTGAGAALSGSPAPLGGVHGTTSNCNPPADGGDPPFDSAEAGGGGGGVFTVAVTPATDGDADDGDVGLIINDGLVGLGGNAGTLAAFAIDTFTTVGGGGGAGEYGCAADTTVTEIPGTGGGAGGGIHIIAGGDVTISGTINAFGGNGGPGTGLGAGGGGGAGGAIVIQTLGQIDLTLATLNANGGARGVAGTNARGGEGGPGLIVLEDVDGLVDTTGSTLVTPAPIIRPVSGTEAFKLNSDISCGIVSEKDKNKDFFYQMSFGFLLAVILMGLSKILFRPQMKI